jgi:hypothetical protein
MPGVGIVAFRAAGVIGGFWPRSGSKRKAPVVAGARLWWRKTQED